MSADHGVGGHEIDQMPNGRLFNLLIALSVATLISCVAVVQLFNAQVRSLLAERSKSNTSLKNYNDEMARVLDGKQSVYEFQVGGKDQKVGVISVAQAQAKVLENPEEAFTAAPVYDGWDRAAAVKEFERATSATPAKVVPMENIADGAEGQKGDESGGGGDAPADGGEKPEAAGGTDVEAPEGEAAGKGEPDKESAPAADAAGDGDAQADAKDERDTADKADTPDTPDAAGEND